MFLNLSKKTLDRVESSDIAFCKPWPTGHALYYWDVRTLREFSSYADAVTKWDTEVIPRATTYSRVPLKTTTFRMPQGGVTQDHYLTNEYWVRMQGKFRAGSTGTYQFGVTMYNGGIALRVGSRTGYYSTTSSTSQTTIISNMQVSRKGYLDFDLFYRHKTNTSSASNGGFYIYLKHPGESSWVELAVTDVKLKV